MYQTYELFDLRIFRGQNGVYPVEVLRSPAGEAAGEVSLPFGKTDLKAILERLEAGEVDREFLQDVGQKLYQMLFVPAIQRRYSESLASLEGNQGLRVRLRVDPPELAPLPWEFLFDPQNKEFLSLSPRAPLVRYIAAGAVEPLQVEAPVRLLLVVSNPSDAPPLDTQKEIALVQEALAPQVQSGHYILEVLENPTLHRLADGLRKGYHAMHFVGHAYLDPADGKGYLILEDEEGASLPVEADTLAPMLKDTPLRLLVLNACESGRSAAGDAQASGRDAQLGLAPSLVAGGMSAVVAMQFPVPDQTSIALAREFYAALADNAPVDAAITQARNVIRAELGSDSMDWGIPILFMRAPDGHILEVKAPPRPKGAALFSTRGWVAIGTVLAVILVLLGVLAYANLQSAGVLPTPTPTLVAEAAEENEFLVVVAEFHPKTDEVGVEVPARLEPQVRAAFETYQVPNARVVGVPDQPATPQEAIELAQRYKASIVVWGWYDSYGLAARVEVIDSPWLESIGQDKWLLKQTSQALDEVDIYETTPETLRAYISSELASTVNYLILYTVGRIHYWQAVNLRKAEDPSYEDEYRIAKQLFDQAIVELENIGSSDPAALGAEVLFFSRGTTFIRLREWEEAAEDFEQAIQIKPDYPQAHFNLAFVYHYSPERNLDLALQEYQLTVETDATPSRWMSILGYWGMGWLHYQRGEYEEAISATQRAIDMNPEDQSPDDELEMQCNLGLYHLAASNPISATAAYNSAVSLATTYSTDSTAGILKACEGDLNHLLEQKPEANDDAMPILDEIIATQNNLSSQEESQ